MTSDRYAFITAYRVLYGGTEIDADRKLRDIERDTAQALLEDRRRFITALQKMLRRRVAEAAGRKAYAEDLKAELINQHVAFCQLTDRYEALKRASDAAYKLIDKHTPYGRHVPLPNVVNWLIENKNMWRGWHDQDSRELRKLKDERHRAMGALMDAGIYPHTLEEGISKLLGKQHSQNERTTRTVVRVISVSENEGKLDCCDEETAHVWVEVITWSGRRAYLTSASPFMKAANGAVPDLLSLQGKHFYADLPIDPPPAQPDAGERLEWPGLELCPPIEEIKKQLGIDNTCDPSENHAQEGK